jgi:hypothetical protein
MNLYGLKVLDFHAHFPIQRSTGGGSSYSKAIVDRYGEEKARIIIGQTARYREEWRHRWGFDPPESGSHTDEEQAVRWIADMDRKGVERVNFVMGGGNDNLARIVKMYPDRFTGFAHHDLFSEDAAVELERAVKELGLRGYKMIASALTRPVDDHPHSLWCSGRGWRPREEPPQPRPPQPLGGRSILPDAEVCHPPLRRMLPQGAPSAMLELPQRPNRHLWL